MKPGDQKGSRSPLENDDILLGRFLRQHAPAPRAPMSGEAGRIWASIAGARRRRRVRTIQAAFLGLAAAAGLAAVIFRADVQIPSPAQLAPAENVWAEIDEPDERILPALDVGEDYLQLALISGR